MKQKSTTSSLLSRPTGLELLSKTLQYLRGFPDANTFLIKEIEEHLRSTEGSKNDQSRKDRKIA